MLRDLGAEYEPDSELPTLELPEETIQLRTLGLSLLAIVMIPVWIIVLAALTLTWLVCQPVELLLNTEEPYAG